MSASPRPDRSDPSLVLPRSVRFAGWLGLAEGGIGLIIAVVLIVREANGVHNDAVSGYGTAALSPSPAGSSRTDAAGDAARWR